MRRLRARRYGPVRAEPGCGSAIAEREHPVIARRLQARAHHELVEAIALEPVQIPQEGRRAHARGPDHELRRYRAAVGEPHALRQYLGDAGLGQHVDLEIEQELLGRERYALR